MTTDTKLKQFTATWQLTAGQTDAQGLMPLPLVVARAIEAATLHANALAIGYSDLATRRLGWVLARLGIRMHRYPRINETYCIDTWIEGYNRFFSDRCYAMYTPEGEPLADIRSQWVAIDTATRRMADLSELERDSFPTQDRPCLVPRLSRPAIAPGCTPDEAAYTFTYCDIDFNRHVNTVRYLEAVLNTRPLEFYDTHRASELEMSFERECHFGQTVRLLTGPSRSGAADGLVTDIICPDGARAVGIRLVFI